MAEQGKLVVVLGTTACGKSGLGVELALRFGGEIVSADSRQVYRGLDLGTGKITAEETKGVPHYLLDIVSPNESYSVAQFQQDAYAAIDDILSRGKPPFLVGGTGLYVRAVAEGYTFQEAKPDPELRARLEQQDAPALYALFQEKTGLTLSESERHNRQRLIRTLEKVFHGDSLTESPRNPRYQVLQLGMTYPREVLNQRIEERLWRRVNDGMIEEVANLRANGATDAFLEGLGLEYRHILWYLQGRYQSVDQLCEELGRAIHQFAKRQVSWFKKDRDVLWLDTDGDFLAQATEAVERFLEDKR